MKLIIGNKRYSSWSLRPWLLMKHFDIPFEEILIGLDQPDTTIEILKFSPSKKVPALVDGDLSIWDSLSIMEYVNEKFPEKQMWPKDPKQRAWARSISCEMHSGFQVMREHLSMDLQKNHKDFDWTPAKDDILRVKKIWIECLKKSGGPFLFGEFSIADAMYAPVANRFFNYGVVENGLSNDGSTISSDSMHDKIIMECVADYVKVNRALPAHALWIEQALKETVS